MGSDGFEKVLIGTLKPRETFLRGAKRRAAKNSVLAMTLRPILTLRGRTNGLG
jgi:hypothetical protein